MCASNSCFELVSQTLVFRDLITTNLQFCLQENLFFCLFFFVFLNACNTHLLIWKLKFLKWRHHSFCLWTNCLHFFQPRKNCLQKSLISSKNNIVDIIFITFSFYIIIKKNVSDIYFDMSKNQVLNIGREISKCQHFLILMKLIRQKLWRCGRQHYILLVTQNQDGSGNSYKNQFIIYISTMNSL